MKRYATILKAVDLFGKRHSSIDYVGKRNHLADRRRAFAATRLIQREDQWGAVAMKDKKREDVTELRGSTADVCERCVWESRHIQIIKVELGDGQIDAVSDWISDSSVSRLMNPLQTVLKCFRVICLALRSRTERASEYCMPSELHSHGPKLEVVGIIQELLWIAKAPVLAYGQHVLWWAFGAKAGERDGRDGLDFWCWKPLMWPCSLCGTPCYRCRVCLRCPNHSSWTALRWSCQRKILGWMQTGPCASPYGYVDRLRYASSRQSRRGHTWACKLEGTCHLQGRDRVEHCRWWPVVAVVCWLECTILMHPGTKDRTL